MLSVFILLSYSNTCEQAHEHRRRSMYRERDGDMLGPVSSTTSSGGTSPPAVGDGVTPIGTRAGVSAARDHHTHYHPHPHEVPHRRHTLVRLGEGDEGDGGQ